jgi:hypothetical protein
MEESVTQLLDSVNPKASRLSWQPCDGPLFVVGMFRSGTSLLYALLNQHPQIALMYEGDLAHLPSLFWLPTDTRKWLVKWNFWNGAVSRHKIDPHQIPPGISDLKTAVREAYIAYARQKTGATIWGCKSPTYFDEVSRLASTFPNARFVIIWRDLRSICRSILKAAEKPSYFRRKGITLRSLIGYHELKKQSDDLIFRGVPVHQIYYEDLVRDPSAAMQGICEFLQIPFDTRMTSLKGADRAAIEDAPHHSRVKAERIVPSNGVTGLPPALQSKIDRYLTLWRKQYTDAWPLYPRSLKGTTTPTLWERCWDRLRFAGLQLWYHTTPIVFSFIPLRFWKAYRRLRGRPYAAESVYELGLGETQNSARR